MNKAELIDAITERLGDKKTAAHAVEAVVDTITRAVAKGEKVAVTGFGVFEKQVRGARVARNPATGASIRLKKTAVPKFRPGTHFKEVVSGAKKLAPAPKATSAAAKKTTGPATGRTRKTTAEAAPTTKTTTGRSRKTAAATTAEAAPTTTRKSAGTGTARKTTAKTTTAAKRAAAKGAAAAPASTKATAKRTTARKR